MDGKRAAPLAGRRVVFLRGYVPVGRDPCVPPPGTHFSAGHAGPAPTDGMLNRVSGTTSRRPISAAAPRCHCVRSTQRVLASRCVATRQSVFLFLGRRIPTPVFALARNDRKHRRAARHARHARRVRSFIYWSRGGIYRATMWRREAGFWGICALGLGLGILIAAVFPVGCLMFLVAFLLIACGVACLRDRR